MRDAAVQAAHVCLNAFDAPIFAAGIGLVKGSDAGRRSPCRVWANIIPPEGWRALHQVLRAAELGDEVGVAAIVPGGFKFIVKRRVFPS